MLHVEEKTWNQFWAAYWRIDDRHSIPGIFEWDRQLVDFIEHVCRLSPPSRILDLGCGGGDQAKVFSRKGYDVIGISMRLWGDASGRGCCSGCSAPCWPPT